MALDKLYSEKQLSVQPLKARPGCTRYITDNVKKGLFGMYRHVVLGLVQIKQNSLDQRSPTFLAPGTGFVEDNSAMDGVGGGGWFRW